MPSTPRPSVTASEGPRHANRVESVCSFVRYTVGECLSGIVGRLGNLLPAREALHAWPRPEVAREAPQGGNAADRRPRRSPVFDVHRRRSLTSAAQSKTPERNSRRRRPRYQDRGWPPGNAITTPPSTSRARWQYWSVTRRRLQDRHAVKRMPRAPHLGRLSNTAFTSHRAQTTLLSPQKGATSWATPPLPLLSIAKVDTPLAQPSLMRLDGKNRLFCAIRAHARARGTRGPGVREWPDARRPGRKEGSR